MADYKLGAGADKLVGDEPILIARANPNRTTLNIYPGQYDLWWGNESVRAGTVRNKVPGGIDAHVTLTDIKAEIWVVRAAGLSAVCGVSEETYNG